MGPKVNWTWRPNDAGRKLFNEWRSITIGYLVSSREGCGVRGIPNYLVEHTGEMIPLEKMGFRTIQQFLYEMRDDIEVRLHSGKLFIFIREAAIPPNMKNIRELVLGQAKDKGCKRGGVIKRPTRAQSSPCSPEDLFLPWQELVSRAPTACSSWTGTSSRRVSVSSRFPSARAPRRPFRIQGLVSDDEDSDSDDGFEFYSGPSAVKDKDGKDKVTYSTTKVTVVKVEPKKSERTPEATASSSTAAPTSFTDKTDVKTLYVRRKFGSWSSSEDDNHSKDKVTSSPSSTKVMVAKVDPKTSGTASEATPSSSMVPLAASSGTPDGKLECVRKRFGSRTSSEDDTDGEDQVAYSTAKVMSWSCDASPPMTSTVRPPPARPPPASSSDKVGGKVNYVKELKKWKHFGLGHWAPTKDEIDIKPSMTARSPRACSSDKAEVTVDYVKKKKRKDFGPWTSSEDESDVNPSVTPRAGTKSEDLRKPLEKPNQVEAVALASTSEVKSQDDVAESAHVSVQTLEPVQYVWKRFGEWTSDESECEDNVAVVTGASNINNKTEGGLSEPMDAGEQPQPDAKTEGKSTTQSSAAYTTQDEIEPVPPSASPDFDSNEETRNFTQHGNISFTSDEETVTGPRLNTTPASVSPVSKFDVVVEEPTVEMYGMSFRPIEFPPFFKGSHTMSLKEYLEGLKKGTSTGVESS